MAYFMSLDPMALFRSMPVAFAQGIVWGLMALGVYITYRLLDFADLTVDGSLATGGAVAVMLIRGGMNPWLALIFALQVWQQVLLPVSCIQLLEFRNSCQYPDTDFSLFHQLKYHGMLQSGCQR